MPPPTPPHRLARRLPTAIALTLAACSSVPPTTEGHVHRITTTVTITNDGLLPDPQVDIPAFSTIVWRNHTSQPATIEVGDVPCHECDTVLGFAPTASGAHSASVVPGDVVTLCFHEVGSFPFVTHAGAAEHHGTIRVGGAR